MANQEARKKLDEMLRQAAGKGRLEDMARLLGQGADINGKKDKFFSLKMTPLGTAIFNGQLKALNYLLEHGADPNKACQGDQWPLHLAVLQGSLPMVQALLKHGADPGKRDFENKTALDVARDAEAFGLMFELRHAMAPKAPPRKAAKPVQTAQTLRGWNEAPGNPDLVVLRGDALGRTMEEVYNFSTFERLTVFRTTDGGPIEAVVRQNFSDLGSRSSLRQAFNEHIRRGGNTPEAEIFPPSLGKAILPRKRYNLRGGR